jgi:hypothetical protein
MLGPVKKLIEPVAGGDLGGRFGAWWAGREYVAPVPEEGAAGEGETEKSPKADGAEAEAETPAESKTDKKADKKAGKKKSKPEPIVTVVLESEAPPPAADAIIDSAAIRLRALETIWGEGRFGPGSDILDTHLLDEVFTSADVPGDIGFIGADGAMLKACAARSERIIRAAEWRAGCVDRLREAAPGAVITPSEIDRPRGFSDGSLEGLVTIEAFAYADHKAGLVGRVHRALSETGRWVFLDTTRRSNKTPAEAFASAWAEPLLATRDEIADLLALAGFTSVRRENATAMVLAAAREGYERLSQALETAATDGLQGSEGALFLQELAWEAQSWRARMRALDGGALSVDLWIADKRPMEATPETAAPAEAAVEPETAQQEIVATPEATAPETTPEVADQAAIDSLFD